MASAPNTLNNALLSEVIFTNDEAFTSVDIEKAKMMLCVCKNAKHNKNIKMSFDKVKIERFCRQIKIISTKKAKKELYNRLAEELDGDTDLNIKRTHKARVMKIIANVLKENQYIIEGVKERMIIEQILNTEKYYNELTKAVSVVTRLGIDMNNITDEDREICDEDDEYVSIKYNRVEIATIFKYNSYWLNMLVNPKKEKEIIEYISSEHYDTVWWNSKTPTIHPV
jgi:transcriptional regulator